MKNLIFSYSIFSSTLFFMIMRILGYEINEDSGSGSYHLVSSVIALLCFVSFFIYISKKKNRSKNLIFSFSILSFVLLGGVISEDLLNSYFLQFIVLCIPASFAGIYYGKYDNAIKLCKWLDIFMLIISLSLILSLQRYILSVLSNDVNYSQELSYNAALCFLLNVFLLNEKCYEYRFSYVKYFIYRAICICLLPFYLFTIALAGGRGGFVTLVVGLLVYIYFKKISKIKLLIVIISCSLVIFLFLYLFNTNASVDLLELFGRSTSRIFSYIGDDGLDVTQSSGRDIIAKNAFVLISQEPLLGYGLFDYVKLLGTYPHNIIIEWLLQGGIVFASIASIFVSLIIIRAKKLFYKHERLRVIAPLMVFPFTMLLFSGRWVSHPYFWFSVFFVLNFTKTKVIRATFE